MSRQHHEEEEIQQAVPGGNKIHSIQFTYTAPVHSECRLDSRHFTKKKKKRFYCTNRLWKGLDMSQSSDQSIKWKWEERDSTANLPLMGSETINERSSQESISNSGGAAEISSPKILCKLVQIWLLWRNVQIKNRVEGQKKTKKTCKESSSQNGACDIWDTETMWKKVSSSNENRFELSASEDWRGGRSELMWRLMELNTEQSWMKTGQRRRKSRQCATVPFHQALSPTRSSASPQHYIR